MAASGDISTFLGSARMWPAAASIVDSDDLAGCPVVFATNCFLSVARGQVVSDSYLQRLDRVWALGPDCIIINETFYSTAWPSIFACVDEVPSKSWTMSSRTTSH